MGKEHLARSFRSGDSVAIQLPAALGVTPDISWTVVERGGELVLRRAATAEGKIDVSGFAGKMPWLKPIAPEARAFAERPSTRAAWDAIQGGDPETSER